MCTLLVIALQSTLSYRDQTQYAQLEPNGRRIVHAVKPALGAQRAGDAGARSQPVRAQVRRPQLRQCELLQLIPDTCRIACPRLLSSPLRMWLSLPHTVHTHVSLSVCLVSRLSSASCLDSSTLLLSHIWCSHLHFSVVLFLVVHTSRKHIV